MAPSVLYHCTCTSVSTSSIVPPEPGAPSASLAFHQLHTLYFCEECDFVRCNRCVSVEVSGYYCPNCLFEVPSASVRAEKNRCARNCFQCPHCRNTLSVVPSDPEGADLHTPLPQTGETIGEPPFFLYCNYCRWDSAEVGITFEKPTGLALQLQKLEDNLPDSIEFDRLKDHFEPLIRSSSSSSHHNNPPSSHHHNAIMANASSALARDVPGLRQSTRSSGGRTYSNPKAPSPGLKGKDAWDSVAYKSRLEAASGVGMGQENDIEWVKELDEKNGIEAVADVEQRWLSSWMQSMKSSELHPLRIPLHSKKTKRCHACRHILIRPEQKAQSVRYKIKLMAANYLPSIVVIIPSLLPTSIQPALPKSKIKAEEDNKDAPTILQPGKTYPFHMTLTNPLYESILCRLSIHRAPPRMTSSTEPPPRPSFAVNLPSAQFSISAFAEAWEYEDDDDMFDEDDLEEMLSGGGHGGGGDLRRKPKAVKGNVGVLERKANITKIGGEVIIGREGTGDVKFNLQVWYTYTIDDPSTTDETAKPSTTAKASEAPSGDGGVAKTFSFFIAVNLGVIASKQDKDAAATRRDSVSTSGGR